MPNSDYRKMFKNLGEFKPNNFDLDSLALYLTRTPEFYPKNLDLGNRFDREETNSSIPSGYTYFAQFIDHDISFDSKSDRFTTADNPWENITIDEIENKCNPSFDLETLYGFDEHGNIPKTDLLKENSSTILKLEFTQGESGSLNELARREYPNDFPRDAYKMANIYDKRNDENFLLAQTQIAFMKFHNSVAQYLNEKIGYKDSPERFKLIREVVIRHYQYIILNDYLPKIVKRSVLEKVKNEVPNNRFYTPDSDDIYIPLEFAVAAFRTGHSMIRPSYKLNSEFNYNNPETLGNITSLTGRGGLLEKAKVSSKWLINWRRFYNIDNSATNNTNFNFAKKINTQYADVLGILRPGADMERANSLSALDLFRGRLFGLPTGQAVAEEITRKCLDDPIRVLTEVQINSRLPGGLRETFSKETPLLFYILAEAEFPENEDDNDKLGDVGSWIMAETIVRLIYETPISILKEPMDSFKYFLAEDRVTFGMPEMLKFMAYYSITRNFDELSPIG